MKVDKVKVGVVGLGLVSFSHMDAYQAHPDAEIIAVCDRDEEKAKKRQKSMVSVIITRIMKKC